eukprot:7871609-Heterocapsa_arctica.AAC.1
MRGPIMSIAMAPKSLLKQEGSWREQEVFAGPERSEEQFVGGLSDYEGLREEVSDEANSTVVYFIGPAVAPRCGISSG